MATAATLRITPDDLLRMPDEGKGFELVDGELREMTMSQLSSYTAGHIHNCLYAFCAAKHPGWVFPEGASFRCFKDDPNRVRRPDTSYIALERLSAAEFYKDGHCPIVPDLAVEVVSPNDTARDVEEKNEEWLEAGVALLWVIYPDNRLVRIHRPDRTVTQLRAADTLTAPEVLPGFSCPVADLFRLPGESPVPA